MLKLLAVNLGTRFSVEWRCQAEHRLEPRFWRWFCSKLGSKWPKVTACSPKQILHPALLKVGSKAWGWRFIQTEDGHDRLAAFQRTCCWSVEKWGVVFVLPATPLGRSIWLGFLRSEGKKNFRLFFMDYESPISVSDFAKILRFMMTERTWDSCFATCFSMGRKILLNRAMPHQRAPELHPPCGPPESFGGIEEQCSVYSWC